jgi:hypothetical protein
VFTNVAVATESGKIRSKPPAPMDRGINVEADEAWYKHRALEAEAFMPRNAMAQEANEARI